MKDADKVLCQEGIRLASRIPFVEERFITDGMKWNTFIYVYGETYSKNDRLLWEIPDESDACKAYLVEEGDFIYLFYKEWDGQMSPIAFTHRKFLADHIGVAETIPAWWN